MNNKSLPDLPYLMSTGKIICLKCRSGNIRPYEGEFFCNNCGLLFYYFEEENVS